MGGKMSTAYKREWARKKKEREPELVARKAREHSARTRKRHPHKSIYSGLYKRAKEHGHAPPAMTVDEFKVWFESRELVCRLCGAVPPVKMCCDHDHVTGKMRGVLCMTCNAHLGIIERFLSDMCRHDDVLRYLYKENDLGELQRQHVVMIDYLHLRLRLHDLHGVQDAASDLREIEAKISALEKRAP